MRAGYCASYYLCEYSRWHPRALVMQSSAPPKLSSDKDIPWLVSWAIASFTCFVSGEKPGPTHRAMGKSSGDVGLAPHPVLWASSSTWALFFSLIFSPLAQLNWKVSQPWVFSNSVLALLTLQEHEIKKWKTLWEMSSDWQGPGRFHSLLSPPQVHSLPPEQH